MKGLPFMLAKDKIRASAKTDSTASCCCVADLEIALIAKLCPDTLSCAKKTLPFCFGFCIYDFFFVVGWDERRHQTTAHTLFGKCSGRQDEFNYSR